MPSFEIRSEKNEVSAVPVAASDATAEKLKVPALCGVPLITPEGEMLNPAGNGDVRDGVHVSPPPFHAMTCWEYGTPTVPSCNVVWKTVYGRTVNVKVRTPMFPTASVACSVKLKGPDASGIPKNTKLPAAPLASNESPDRIAKPGGSAVSAVTV